MKLKLLLCILVVCSMQAIAQEDKKDESHNIRADDILFSDPFKSSLGEMLINFGNAEDKFLRFSLSSQLWLRMVENNPGTAVNSHPQDNTYDASIRRMRIIMNAQLSNWYSIQMQFGINNQSFISGGPNDGTGALGAGKKPQIFFMDAYNEVALKPRINAISKTLNRNHLYVGLGLHGWAGVSRMTNASTTKMLTADLPVLNFPNIEVSDQFARQFGVFAHGEFDRFNYRVAINKPFATDRLPTLPNVAVENNLAGALSYSMYGMYQFWDKELTSTAFFAGTYLGYKRVFNIGGGIYFTKDAALTFSTDRDVLTSHNQTNAGLDVFVDMPIGAKEKEAAFSFYSVIYKNQFGPNYLRFSGILNPGEENPDFEGQVALEGFGNNRILNGTGYVWYTQTGYVLPKFSNKFKVQPFISYEYKDFDGVNQIGHFYNLGANLYILSQNAKLVYQYQSRPLYTIDTRQVFTRRGEHILSLQITL
ncbi:hypothetical protein M8998_03200 [Sphingobacterium sp. lm-10]|uniref:hypothetical protein n=1 Tax=Sphingobacterium sp. lm-10 TaxID=2944904 RepID=UPI0020217935|nr:hypothetical protein [Sphingobacterium sp. lm-10]MCL7986943.1 hypothetical protein [Sphingobacterium sp. lm-10]